MQPVVMVIVACVRYVLAVTVHPSYRIEPQSLLQIHVPDLNQAMAEDVDAGLALLQHKVSDQRLVLAILVRLTAISPPGESLQFW